MSVEVREGLQLSGGELRWCCDADWLDFATTAEVEPIAGVVGQDDAIEALRYGLEVFALLADLDVGGARVYVGAIHHMHGAGGPSAQIDNVGRYLPDFGLAAPCGFGRAPERPGRLLADEGTEPHPNTLDIIVGDHRRAAALLDAAA